MSLVRFSYTERPLDDLKKKIRHLYDLHQLMKQAAFCTFLQSVEFERMLLQVAYDDKLSFRNNNMWLVHHPVDALIFRHLEVVWRELRFVYINDFGPLVFGDLPKEEDVLSTLRIIRERLLLLDWAIKIN